MNNGFMKVEMIQQYDVATQEYVETKSLKLNLFDIQNGLIKELGATDFAILCAIASFCNSEGECFPSQRKLADIVGMSKTTVNSAIKRLLKAEIEGKPVLSRELETLGSRTTFSVYSFVDKEPKKDSKPKKRTSKDFVAKFKTMFEDEYGFACVVNYGRDCTLIKSKLLNNFPEELVDYILETTIKTYKERWGTPKYQYPTISMMCGWVGDTIVKEYMVNKEKVEEQQKLIDEAGSCEVDAERFDSILDL